MKYFEWDEDKRKINLRKHEIDFIDAIQVFEDTARIEHASERNGEKRFQTIGTIEDVIILVVYVLRAGKKRIISARCASKKRT